MVLQHRRWIRSARVIREVFFDRRILVLFFLLIVMVFVDSMFLRPIFSELDILEHFLFGLLLSEVAHKSAATLGLDKRLSEKLNRSIYHTDLLIRLFVFLSLGALLWEAIERFLFPVFGVGYNPFFTFPITLHNVDGTLDVMVGFIGCVLAWHIYQKTKG